MKKSKKNDGKAEPKAAEKSGVDASAAQGSRTIFCKNLPWSTSDEDLAGFFADCGEVTECRIGECFAVNVRYGLSCTEVGVC